MRRRDFLKICAVALPGMALSSEGCSPSSRALNSPTAYVNCWPKTRIEPIFEVRTPLLFAHRGGARETAESTILGFQHAVDSRSDVLELDVQLTKDAQMVVWHGPELDNVRIDNVCDRPAKRIRRKIFEYAWCELDRKAWVADPEVKDLDIEEVDLSQVPQLDNRGLLLLPDFMDAFPNHPLNIELKESFAMPFDAPHRAALPDNIKAFCEVLDLHARKRPIVVVSADTHIIKEFRRQVGNRYPTGLSGFEQLLFCLGAGRDGPAFETSHFLVTDYLVRRVHRSGGSIFVFVTEFGPIQALDQEIAFSEEIRSKIVKLLDMGVDGLMTDRPAEMRKVIDSWTGA